jgi:pantoate--beta-alanine ligase
VEVLGTKEELATYLKHNRAASKGLVPTMGALHDGHVSLVDLSKRITDLTLVSIFVNPTQFNNQKDLEKYPRTEQVDMQILEKAGCDAVFMPDADEIYHSSMMEVSFNVGYIGEILEGKNRPGHFNGVCQVLTKLFSLTRPDMVFFGQKDLQQCYVVKKLIESMLMPIEMHIGKTIREDSGLAMSSRNERLSKQGKKEASGIFLSLKSGKDALEAGSSPEESLAVVEESLDLFPNIQLEQIDVVCLPDFTIAKPEEILTGGFSIVFSGFLEGVRLIDNITGHVSA